MAALNSVSSLFFDVLCSCMDSSARTSIALRSRKLQRSIERSGIATASRKAATKLAVLAWQTCFSAWIKSFDLTDVLNVILHAQGWAVVQMIKGSVAEVVLLKSKQGIDLFDDSARERLAIDGYEDCESVQGQRRSIVLN
jgi:hypothetical protein